MISESEKYVGRFAPSPTGRMHLGNVFSALLSWLSAKAVGGKWLLRIEDIDPQRSKRQYADLLMQDLEWLGLTWDESPVYQSRRSEVYEYYLGVLREKGVLYPSYKTRAERLAVSAPQDSNANLNSNSNLNSNFDFNSVASSRDGRLGGHSDVGLNVAAAMAVRVDDVTVSYTDGHYGVQRVSMSDDIGDFVVRRRDGAWAYQLCVTVDDALMGVTEVVRGRDLLRSGAQQIYLARLLGLREMRYCHFPLLVNEAGQRLSKRDRSLDMGVLRERYSPRELVGVLACLAGIVPEVGGFSPEELVPLFRWDDVPVDDIGGYGVLS